MDNIFLQRLKNTFVQAIPAEANQTHQFQINVSEGLCFYFVD